MNFDPTVAAAVIAATAALVGYSVTQSAQRRGQKSLAFAEALKAVRAVEELPFLIWRRADTSAATVRDLGVTQSSAISDVAFHAQLLAIEEAEVARAYHLLQSRTRRQSARHRDRAWASPLVATGVANTPDPGFSYDNGPELLLCIATMRAATRWWGPMRRPALARRRRQLESRDNLGRSATEWFRPLDDHDEPGGGPGRIAPRLSEPHAPETC